MVNGCAIRPETFCPYAHLESADLPGANLSGANLTRAQFKRTTCPDGRMVSSPGTC